MKKFTWSPQKYIELVENSRQPLIRDYEDTELKYILSIKDLADRTVVDVGAGYGRVLKKLVGAARDVVGVEFDNDMYKYLRETNGSLANALLVKGDANKLTELLKNQILQKPLIVCMQNTLGPWIGNWKTAVSEMRKLAESNSGDVVISVWRQEGLKDFGIDFYKTATGLLGEPDLVNTDFEGGVYKTKNGYSSQWFTEIQRAEILRLLEGKIVKQIEKPAFWILHVSYN